jgi:hypothetical protein
MGHGRPDNCFEDKDQLKVQFGLSAMGSSFQDPQINIEYHKEDGSPYSVLLMGVEEINLAKEQQAAIFMSA